MGWWINGMNRYCIIPRVGDKELPRVGHQLAFFSLLNSYVLMYLEKPGEGKLWKVRCHSGLVSRADSYSVCPQLYLTECVYLRV